MFKKAGIIPTCEPLSLNLTKLVSFEQGGKCRDISAIYRRNIVCRRVSTRYFLEKYRSSDFSAFIARNRRFLAIYRWFGDKSAIFLRYIAGQRKSNPQQCPSTRYSASHFACCWEDLNPKPKGLGFTRLPPGLSSPLINNMQQLYIYLNSLYKENIKIF